MTPEELTVPSTKRVMNDESCVSGESRTVGCESKGRARGGSVVLRRRRRADVVVIRKHPRVDETRRASSERASDPSKNQSNLEPPKNLLRRRTSRKCATPRIGAKVERYASIDVARLVRFALGAPPTRWAVAMGDGELFRGICRAGRRRGDGWMDMDGCGWSSSSSGTTR